MKVVVGSNLLDTGGDSYEVEKLISHPSFSLQKIANDIALVKVKDDIVFGPAVKPIELPSEDTPGGQELVLSGWGTTSVSSFLFKFCAMLKMFFFYYKIVQRAVWFIKLFNYMERAKGYYFTVPWIHTK